MIKRWVLFFVLISLIGIFLVSDFSLFLSFEYLLSKHQDLISYYQAQPILAISLFCAAYTILSALCIPGTYILTILSGAVFGLALGTLASSFSSALGALIAFSGSRWIFRDYVQTHFTKYIDPFNKGIINDGPLYLFMLRLTPLVPFFAINLVMGIMPIRTSTFYCVTQIGMFVPTLIYVNAGTQLGTIRNLEDIFTAKIFMSLLALAVLPLAIKKIPFVSKRLKRYSA